MSNSSLSKYQPTTNNQQPATNNQQPATNNRADEPPTTVLTNNRADQQPATDNEPPTTKHIIIYLILEIGNASKIY